MVGIAIDRLIDIGQRRSTVSTQPLSLYLQPTAMPVINIINGLHVALRTSILQRLLNQHLQSLK
jgi:hypothetical protein